MNLKDVKEKALSEHVPIIMDVTLDKIKETIKEIAKLKPLTAVFKDSSFESSQDKVNLAEHFRIISPDTKVKVV